jgi:hypothetical protein
LTDSKVELEAGGLLVTTDSVRLRYDGNSKEARRVFGATKGTSATSVGDLELLAGPSGSKLGLSMPITLSTFGE